MKMKRALCLLLSFIMLCGLLTVSASTETKTVKNIIWDFESPVEGLGTVSIWRYQNGEQNFHQFEDGNHAFDIANMALANGGGYRVDLFSACYGAQPSNWDASSIAVIPIPDSVDLTKVKGKLGFSVMRSFPYSTGSDYNNNLNCEAVGLAFEGKDNCADPHDKIYAIPFGHLFQDAEYKWEEFNLMGRTYTNIFVNTDRNSGSSAHTPSADDTIVLTEELLQDPNYKLKGIYFFDAGFVDNTNNNYNYKYFLDDVFYEIEEGTDPVASFDNGVADIEAVDGVVTMPTATIEGKQLFGWQDAEGKLYKAGAQVEIAEDTAFTAVAGAIDLQTGAGIRWAEREQERGIRFETYVSKDALDALGSSNFELGALILPYENYDADITVETASNYGALNVVDPKVYGTVEDNYRYYTGVVNFEKYFAVSQAAMADLKLTAVSYVKVTYADGSFAYFYDHPSATDNVRTVSEVARAALADTEFGYTEDQKAILNLYTKYSAEDTVPEYRKDDADKVM